MTDKEIIERAKSAEKRTKFGEIVHNPISNGVNSAYGIGFIDGMEEYRSSLHEEPVSEDFEEAAIKYLKENWDVDNVYEEDDLGIRNAFKAGAQWQKLKTKKEVIDNAVAWIVIENKNGGCVYDGWEEDFRKAL